MTELWIVGQYKHGDEGNAVWDFQGVFDSEESARAACRDWTYFIGPATLNESLPHETSCDPRWYYPLAEQMDDERKDTPT